MESVGWLIRKMAKPYQSRTTE